jgi:hypothetical protein
MAFCKAIRTPTCPPIRSTIGYDEVSGGGSAPAPFDPDTISTLWGWWQHDYEGSLFTERSNPTTETTDGGVVGTWRSRNTPAQDLLAVLDARRPVWNATKGIQHFWRTDGGTVNARVLRSGLSAFNRNNFGGGGVLDVYGSAYTSAIDFGAGSNLAIQFGGGSGNHKLRYFNGAGFVDTGLYYSARNNVFTWKSDGSALTFTCNGASWTGSALSSVAIGQMVLGGFAGGADGPVRWRELVIASEAPSDAEMTSLANYLRAQAGPVGNGSMVAIVGDSLSIGVGSESGEAWHYRLTNRPSHEWRSYAVDGSFLFANPPISAANLVAAGTGYTEKVAVIWMGTNDVIGAARTGAQLFGNFESYRTTLQSSGWKVIACNLQKMSANDANAVDFNALLAASTAYEGKVDLRAVLPDHTDTTYYTSDGVHLKDAGFALVANAVDAVLASA